MSSKQRIPDSAVLVQILWHRGHDEHGHPIVEQPASSHPGHKIYVLDLASCQASLDDVLQTKQVRSVHDVLALQESSVSFSLTTVSDVLKELVSHQAWSGQSCLRHASASDAADILFELAGEEHVLCRDTEQEGVWESELTPKGLSHLQFLRRLLEPAEVFGVREAPLEDLTSLEMLLRMQAEGWEWMMAPRRVADRAGMVYERGHAQVWYSVGKTVPRVYLHCLLAEPIPVVPHFAVVTVYEHLLAGESLEEALAKSGKRRFEAQEEGLAPDMNEEGDVDQQQDIEQEGEVFDDDEDELWAQFADWLEHDGDEALLQDVPQGCFASDDL